jgi:glycine cleavage system H protein
MDIPADLKYTENDEWASVAGSEGTMGLTDFAQDQLSDIVFVEITVDVGDTVEKGSACAVVESVKAAADVYMPVTGTITAINEALADTPELINSEPYGAAWILKFEAANTEDVGSLLDAAAYEKSVEERSH